jgi:hypothetical protein
VAKKAKNEEVEQVDDAQPATEESVPPGQLGDWREKIPPEVQRATDEYVSSLREANKAKEAMNNAKSNCLAVMDEYDIDSVPIDEGGKRLVRFSEMKLKTKKAEDEQQG